MNNERTDRSTDEQAANALCDQWLRDIHLQYARIARREQRRARIVQASKIIGCVLAGVALAAVAMGAAFWIGQLSEVGR